MRTILFLALADLRRALRERETLFWAFLMPLVFLFFFQRMNAGGAFGPSKGGDRIAIEVGEEGGFLAEEVARRVEQQGYAVERAEGAAGEAEEVERTLSIPAGFTKDVLEGEQATLRLVRKKGGLSADYDQFRIGRAAYTVLADVVTAAEEGEVTPEAIARLAGEPRKLSLKVSQAGERRRIPAGDEHSIPGTMVMFVLIVVLTSGGVPLVVDRQQGLLRRLASSPLGRGEVVLGKWLGVLFLGFVQLAWAFLAGTLLFGMRWGPDPLAVVVVLALFAALASALSVLLGSLARTEAQVVATGVLASNVLAALGGCWWPIEITPRWMQQLASFLPTGWTMNALHGLISFQTGPAAALPWVLCLAGGAAVAGLAAARAFRYA